MSSDRAQWPTDPTADHDFDVSGENLFTAELTNVDASEWDIDTAVLWGEEIDEADPGVTQFGLDLFP